MIFRPRLTLIGFPIWDTSRGAPDYDAFPTAIAAREHREVAIRNRALESTLRAKRTETHDRLRAELGGL